MKTNDADREPATLQEYLDVLTPGTASDRTSRILELAETAVRLQGELWDCLNEVEHLAGLKSGSLIREFPDACNGSPDGPIGAELVLEDCLSRLKVKDLCKSIMKTGVADKLANRKLTSALYLIADQLKQSKSQSGEGETL